MSTQTDSFNQQIAEEIPHLRRYARSLTYTEADGDDLVQATLERALRYEHQYAPGTRLRRWLFTIVRNAHIDELRKHARRRTVQLAEEGPGEPATPASQETSLELQDVSEKLAELRTEEQDVVQLSVFDGLDHGEIAARLNVAVGTVKSRLFRARQALAKSR